MKKDVMILTGAGQIGMAIARRMGYGKKIVVAEAKQQKKNFKPLLLEEKIEVLKTKVLNKYDVDWTCLDITDM